MTGPQVPRVLQESLQAGKMPRLPAMGGLFGKVPTLSELRALAMLAVQQLPRLALSLVESDSDAEEQTPGAAWLIDLRGTLERSQVD